MTPANLHAEGVELLAALRASRERFREVLYEEVTGAHGATSDAHGLLRFKLMLALQYDSAPEDHDLARAVFEQEVVSHERSTFQGLDDSLRLGAYLLCGYRDPQDVWLLWRAKTANFDTECGFDGEYLVSCGVQDTFGYLAGQTHPDKDDLLEYLGGSIEGCPFDASGVERWWEAQRRYFPATPEQENPVTLLYRAISFGAIELGRQLLDAWEAAQRIRDVAMLDHLRRRREDLAQPELAIAAQRELLAQKDLSDHWEVTSATRDLAQILLRAEQPASAWVTILSLQDRLTQFDDWKPCGLGRMVVETAIDASLALPAGHADKATALNWAKARLQEGCSHSPLILERGMEAARELQDEATERFFSKLRLTP